MHLGKQDSHFGPSPEHTPELIGTRRVLRVDFVEIDVPACGPRVADSGTGRRELVQ